MLRAIAFLVLGFLATGASASETPAGYVVSIALSGADFAAKTAVVRGGQELPPKLMMPLFAGDMIFLRGRSKPHRDRAWRRQGR